LSAYHDAAKKLSSYVNITLVYAINHLQQAQEKEHLSSLGDTELLH